MDRPLAFVTGNLAKYTYARERLAGYGVEIERVDLDLDEIQSPAAQDVAMHKARQAFGTLDRPLFVEDSGFAIEELNGWPGPMVKQLVDAVGAAGVSHLADLTTTRRCRFISALVYVDAAGHQVFDDDGGVGSIAHAPTPNPSPDSWSPLWQVFIPRGTNVPLAALSGVERERLFTQSGQRSVFAKLGQWLTSATA